MSKNDVTGVGGLWALRYAKTNLDYAGSPRICMQIPKIQALIA